MKRAIASYYFVILLKDNEKICSSVLSKGVCDFDRVTDQTLGSIPMKFCTHVFGLNISVDFDNGLNRFNRYKISVISNNIVKER